jgi:proteasome lid subunit RPN8/RPN11
MLQMSLTHLAAIRGDGESAYPHEACGVLIGSSYEGVREVQAVVKCGNDHADSPQNRYRIAPQELIAAQKQARASGWEIVGFYHSHPDFPARWSATDLAEAHWLGCSYVITSVQQGRATETRSFVLEGGTEEEKQFADEEIEAR